MCISSEVRPKVITPSWTFVERESGPLAPGNCFNKFAKRSFASGSVSHLTRHHRASAPTPAPAAFSPRLSLPLTLTKMSYIALIIHTSHCSRRELDMKHINPFISRIMIPRCFHNALIRSPERRVLEYNYYSQYIRYSNKLISFNATGI